MKKRGAENKMKKIKLSSLCILLTFLLGCSTVLGAFPNVQYAESETVNVYWNNMSDIKTLSPGHVSFTVEFNSKSSGNSEYTVSYKIGEKDTVTEVVEVPPASSVVRSFGTTLDAGTYDVAISVAKKGIAIYNNVEKIYVMENYDKEWGDYFTHRGIGVHYERVPYMNDLEFTQNLVTHAGFQGARSGSSWEYIEKTKGNYNFSGVEKSLKISKKLGLRDYWLLGYGNGWIYYPERGMKGTENWSVHTLYTMPQTQDSIQGYSNQFLATADYMMTNDFDVITLETWNEYNGKAWVAPKLAQVFTDNVRNIRIKMMLDEEGKYDDVDISTFTNHNNKEMQFLNGCMELNFYPFFDRFSSHKYDFSGGFEANSPYYNSILEFVDFIDDWGGWKWIDISETGFSTPNTNSHSTLESASQEISKLFTTAEYLGIDWTISYDLMNDGTDPLFSEDNFGMVDYEGKPKPEYFAMTNYNNQTAGGILIGEIDTGLEDGVRAYLYFKDGEPVVIAWANTVTGSEVEWNIGETVSVINNYGTVISESTDAVTLGLYPVYIKGMSDKWIKKAVRDDLLLWDGRWLETYAKVIPADLKAKAENLFSSTSDKLLNDVDADSALGLYNDYINFGLEIIASGKAGDIDEMTTSSMLYRLFKNIKKLNSLYITLYSGECGVSVQKGWSERHAVARENNYSNLSIQQYSDAMLKFVKEYTDNVEKLLSLDDNPQKAGMIDGWNKMIESLCLWYDAFAEYETVTNVGLVIQTPYYDRISYVDSEVTTEVNLNNFSKENFVGTICVFDDEGNKVYETPQLSVAADGGYTQTLVKVKTKRPTDDSGCSHYYLSYVDTEGNVIHTQRTEYEVVDRFKVTPVACTTTVDNLKNVSLSIKNLTTQEQKAYISVESDGSFQFKSTKYEATIPAGETAIVEMPIVSIENNKYHFYTFKYTITDENGVVVADNDTALSFTNVVKATNEISVKDFDGNIEDWEDAYPIYINTPNGITTKEAWRSTELSARAFAKWDESHLYLLVDIYDDAYLQTFTGNGMWEGDSVQLSLDPMNDDSVGKYADDDYELGFSNTPLGHEYYAWYAPIKLNMGVVDWFKIIRNDEMHLSRYLISLDKSILTNVEMSEGASFGLNIAINDNDYLSREAFYEFTPGTAGKKDPSCYADFNFIGADGKEMVEGKALNIFPVSVEHSVSVSEAFFTDISGHWAEETINLMADAGHVSGMGDGTFMPNAHVTRAEFMTMLTKAAALSGAKAEYNDISKGAWYYESIKNAESVIPTAMYTENNEILPDKDIVREEAVYMIASCFAQMKKTGGLNVDCVSYPDGADVSEWAVDMMNVALSNTLIQGSDDGKIYPQNTLTRAEAAMMIYNLLKTL